MSIRKYFLFFSVLGFGLLLATMPVSNVLAQSEEIVEDTLEAESENIPDGRRALSEHDSLARILVTAEGAQDGRVIDGYVVKKIKNFGPWGGDSVKDTPYTINVVGEDFMNNLGTMTPRDVFRRIPGIDDNAHSEINVFGYLHVRGFQTTGNTNLGINGIPTGNIGAVLFTEDLNSVEVFSGLSGFAYGIGSVGGMVNYNLKRALYEPATKIRYGTNYTGSLFFHADVGGPIIENKLLYRINALVQDGKTAIKPQSLERKLLSVALDWNINEKLLLRFNGQYGHHFQNGRQGAFTAELDDTVGALSQNALTLCPANPNANLCHVPLRGIPAAPDPEQLWISQDTFNDYKTYLLSTNLDYTLSDQLSFRAGFLLDRWTRETLMTINFFSDDPDLYFWGVAPLKWDRTHFGGFFYMDATFKTGIIDHKVTFGFNGYDKIEKGSGNGGSFTGGWHDGRFSLRDAVNVRLNRDALLDALPAKYNTEKASVYNVMLADQMKIGDKWEIYAGLNRVSTELESWSMSTGAWGGRYQATAFTPTLGVVFKPAPWISTYVSYIESLENGQTVPSNANNWVNAGEILSPTRSNQYEVGAKAQLGDFFLTLALYEIKRHSFYGDPVTKVYSQDGLARHKGIEFSAQGRLFDSLNIYGGINFNNSTNIKNNSAALEGKKLVDAPSFTGKIYLEYDLPFLPGFTLTGSVNHYGKVYTNPLNSLSIPGHTIGDLGFRYATFILGQDMAFRFNIQNITNKAYWYGGSGSHLVVGQPRSYSFIGEINF